MATKSKKTVKTSAGKSSKYVYLFGGGKADGNGQMKPLLGGKGANLAEMSRIGLPVPPGFTITTEVCTYYYQNKKTYPKVLDAQCKIGIAAIEKIMGTKFGDTTALPLLVSVRSGARDSMPGMMDTILNLGLNDQTVLALATATKNERFAWDCYRRFIQMYGDVVMGVQKSKDEDHEPFEVVIHKLKHDRHSEDVEDTKLSVDDLKELVTRFKALIKERTGSEFPQDPWKQLWGSTGAVFGSWMNDRAIVYRRKYGIPSEWGTAVNVQAMVYGNTGAESGSGVAFTRNPANGVKEFYGEFLINAQGEDVVAGVRTPEPVAQLANEMPAAYKELDKIRATLEKHFKDVQDFEFTIQDGKVFMLQTRNGKRTAFAALKFSMDMVKEGLIDWKTAIKRNPADQLDQLLAPIFEAKAEKAARVIAKGLPAGPGAASGKMYLNADRADAAAARGEKVLLVRNETTPEDLRGMIASEGILTAKGGVSSHAALVARQMGKVCVCGAGALQIDYSTKTLTVDGQTFKEGDSLSINGTLGNVYAGQLPTAASEIVQVLVEKSLDPLVWLALAAPLAWRNRPGPAVSSLRWFVITVALLFGMCALTIALFWSANFRYEVEFLPALLLLAVIGILGLERMLADRPARRRAARCGWSLLLVFSVAFNLLASAQYFAEAHNTRGIEFIRQGKLPEAVGQFEQALRIEPEYAAAHNGLGIAFAVLGRLPEAVAHYKLALRIEPDYADAHCNLGIVLAQMGNVAEATDHWERALRSKPDYAEAHYNLGLALERAGKPKEAEKHFEQALRIEPDFMDARDALARLHASR